MYILSGIEYHNEKYKVVRDESLFEECKYWVSNESVKQSVNYDFLKSNSVLGFKPEFSFIGVVPHGLLTLQTLVTDVRREFHPPIGHSRFQFIDNWFIMSTKFTHFLETCPTNILDYHDIDFKTYYFEITLCDVTKRYYGDIQAIKKLYLSRRKNEIRQ